MKKSTAFRIATALLMVFMVAGFAQAQQGVLTFITGKVTAGDQDLPVADYKLLITFKDDTTGFRLLKETAADGSYSFQVFKNMEYTLTSPDTFLYNPIMEDVSVGLDAVVRDIKLTMRDDLLNVTGNVSFDGTGVETGVYFLKVSDELDLDDFREFETHFNVPPMAMRWASYNTMTDVNGDMSLGMILGKYVMYIPGDPQSGLLAHWGVFEVTGEMALDPIVLKEMKKLSGNIANTEQYDHVTVLAHSLNAGRPYKTMPDANGDYSLDVAPGEYVVRVQAFFDEYMYMVFYDSVYTVDEAVRVDVQDDVADINFNLPEAEVYPFSISGTVTSNQSGLPLEGAGVMFSSYNFQSNLFKSYNAKTDADGNYTIEGYTILKEDSLVGFSWKDSSFFAQFYNGQATFLNADPIVYHANEDVTGIDFALDSIDTEDGYSISGTVTDVDGNVIKYGQVTAYTTATSVGQVTAMIDTMGNYSFDPVFPSGSTVYLQCWVGYGYKPQIYNQAESWLEADAVMIDGADVSGIDFKLEETAPARFPLGVIKGLIKDALGNSQSLAKASAEDKYAGAMVYVKPEGTTEWTGYDYVDADGNFSLPIEKDGTYDIRLTTREDGDFDQTITVENLTASVSFAPTDIDGNKTAVIESAELFEAYPNPFNPTTTIRVDVAKAGKASLVVYNVLGQKVKTLFNGNLASGSSKFTWNGTDNGSRQVASGLYFYQLKTNSTVQTKAVMFLK